VFAGALEPAFGTFLLLIAVRRFDASAFEKAWLVAGPSLGLMCGPLVVSAVEEMRVRAARAICWISALSAGFLAVGAFAQQSCVYVAFSMIGGMGLTCTVPLMTQVYQNNYPDARRGRLFSGAFVIRIGVAAVASQLIGWWLTRSPSSYPSVLLVFSSCALAAALCWIWVPSTPLVKNPLARHPLRGLQFVREDAAFRRTLFSWMLMGVGNLVMLPLRVEYLARPAQSGLRTAAEIAVLTAVVPNIARLLTSPLWGRAFDRLSFFTLRSVLNFGFALAIISFFTGDSMGWMLFGAVLYGVSGAGGDVAWSLWVTKMAPPERVADYMAVHTFFTGLRGVVAPTLAFYAAERFSIEGIGWACAFLIVLANLVLWPEIKARRG
jgi:MFS family permease